MTGNSTDPWSARIEPASDELDHGATNLDGYGWEPAAGAISEVAPTEEPGWTRPAINVTFERPTASGQIGVALIRAIAGIPIAIAFGVIALGRAVKAWAERAIPSSGDRALAMTFLVVALTVWTATLALLGPWRLNLGIFGLTATGFGIAGAVDRHRMTQ